MDNNNNNKRSTFDFAASVVRFIKKVPPWLWPAIGWALGAFAIFFLIIILIMSAAGVVEDIKDGVGNFGEKLGNLFTLNGFNTDEEVASQAEKNYFAKLDEVAEDYKEEYGVTIDKTLITATLFYRRTMGDYIVDTGCDDVNSETCDNDAESSEDPSAVADFYKKAKGHIKTLAKYMVVEVETENSCSAAGNSVVNIPEDPKEIAENSVNWFGFDHGNSRKIIRTVAYLDDPNLPGSCPYEDDEEKSINLYKNDPSYQRLNTAYNSMVDKCENAQSDLEIEICQRSQANYNNLSVSVLEYAQDLNIINSPLGSSEISFECPYQHSRAAFDSSDPVYDGCSELPKVTKRYTVDARREGVYYYKLMTRYSTFLGFGEDETFLSKYYGDYVKNEDGTINDEVQLEVVEGIYRLYETLVGKTSLYSADGDYANWKQCGAEWSDIWLGSGSGNSLCQIGCAVTSLAIQIARSGTAVNIDPFNPGTFAEALTAIGGFTSGGAVSNWSLVNQIAPNFSYIDRGDYQLSPSDIESLLQQGYYLIVQVKQSPDTHFVAIDRVENGIVYMFDPASDATDLLSKYTGIYGYRAFYKSD